jgi:hypothetical protein
MRKAAGVFSKTKISDSGDININKIYRYKTEDDIFKKMMIVPKGKSHGIVMLIDKSGSMADSITGTIEQMLVMAMFCRKVNIPFAAYGFTNNVDLRAKMSGTNIATSVDRKIFSTKPNEICVTEIFALHEMISSKMKLSEFNKAVMYQLFLADQYRIASSRSYHNGNFFGLPRFDKLSSTPLNEALICMKPIVQHFKKKYNLEHMNLLVLHDGDSDGSLGYHNHEGRVEGIQGDKNFIIVDKQTKKQYSLYSKTASTRNYRRVMTSAIMRILQQSNDCNVVGFYLIPNSIRTIRRCLENYYCSKDGTEVNYYSDVEPLRKELNTNNFIESYTSGYNRFFFVKGGDTLITDNDELTINGTVTSNKLAKAFIKMNKKRQVNRILVNKLIGIISA